MIRSHPGIPLQKHLQEVGEISTASVREKHLDLSVAGKEQFEKLAYLIGIAHDFGKATTYFQTLIDGRDIKQDTHHAPISSLFAFVLIKENFPENDFLPVLGYLAVRYHHSNLHSPERSFGMGASVRRQLNNLKEKQYSELEEIYNELLPQSIQFSEVFEKLRYLIQKEVVSEKIHRSIFRTYLRAIKSVSEEQQLELFLCCNFLFSVLIDSDKKSAGNLDTDYFKGATEPIIDVGSFINHKRSEEPEKFDPDIPINKLRNSFFKQATTNSKLDETHHLYTITAPTGIGKTFTAFGVANKLKRKLGRPARIIYALPFTSIIDQNYEELEEILEWNLQDDFKKNPTKYLLKHHYLSPMEIERDKADEEKKKIKDYAQYYDDRVLNESWDAGHVVTTFVQLLESIIGYKNRQLKKFHNIVNSIIILDEVQNIPAKFHLLAGKLLRVFANRFNTYFILMTATQPTIFKNEDIRELADAKQLFAEEELNRVNVNCLNNLESVEDEYVIEHVLNNFDNNSTLVVCNTKVSALKIYERLKERFNYSEDVCVYCLTTLQTPTDRLNYIDEFEKKLDANQAFICVSTQLIEAGVDLSFPVVYRDFGPFDSIIQVAGRCNRHGELQSKGNLYLYRLKGENKAPSTVYNKILLQFTGQVLEEKRTFESNDFFQLGYNYFELFDMTGISRGFLRGLKKLNYSEQKRNEEKPVNEFKLIKELPDQVELIICTKPEIEQTVNQLVENRRNFKTTEPYSEERKILIGEALELRQKLANYTIILYKNQLDPYRNSAEIEERFDGKLQFVPYEFYKKKTIYNSKTGFKLNPDTTTQVLSF